MTIALLIAVDTPIVNAPPRLSARTYWVEDVEKHGMEPPSGFHMLDSGPLARYRDATALSRWIYTSVTTVIERVLGHANDGPQRTAITFYGETWSYSDLTQRASEVAAALPINSGVVLVFLPQQPEAIAVWLGIMWAGAIPSFMPLPSAKQDEDRYWASHMALLKVIAPAAIVTTALARRAMEAAGFDVPVFDHLEMNGERYRPTKRSGTDTAFLQHSSGTTGLKKGVMLSHQAVVRQVDSYAAAIGADRNDRVVSWLPIYHDMGLIACTVAPLMCGQSIALLDPFRWSANPPSLFDAITSDRSTLCWMPNFAFEHMVRTTRPSAERYDLSSMRAFINCSEPCKPDTVERFVSRFVPIGVKHAQVQVSYAMAETVFAVTQTRLGQVSDTLTVDDDVLKRDGRAIPSAAGLALASCGRPINGAEIQIIDLQGAILEDGMIGEILIRADFLFDGYYNRPELSSERLTSAGYRSGDRGFIWEGQVYILGRADDLMIVHGRNYHAHEVEAVANRCGLKAGRNVAVNIFNSAVGSEDVILIAEIADAPVDGESDLGELRREIKAQVQQALGLDLRDVAFVAQGWLSKTTSGKISRADNRDRYLKEYGL